MAYILEETISNIRHGGVVSILSVIIITLTTVIVAALTLLHNTIRRDVDAIKSSTAIIVFLSDTISPSEQERLIENISGLRSVKKVVYISKIQALERSNQIFGEFSNIIQGLEAVNPLPASIEIQVQEQPTGEISLAAGYGTTGLATGGSINERNFFLGLNYKNFHEF